MMGRIGFIIILLSLVVVIMRLYSLYQIARDYEEIQSIAHRGTWMHKCRNMQLYLLLIMWLAGIVFGWVELAISLDDDGTGAVMISFMVILGLSLAELCYGISYLAEAYRAIDEYAPDEVVGIETKKRGGTP